MMIRQREHLFLLYFANENSSKKKPQQSRCTTLSKMQWCFVTAVF